MMYQFNRKADLDVVRELCKNKNMVIEGFRDDGTIIVRVAKEPVDQCRHSNPCAVCPLFCKANGICVINPNLK